MRFSKLTINTLFILLLPVVVGLFGLGFWTALLLVLLGLVWRWALTLSLMFDPRRQPPVVLQTISASHYVDKVRWCLDRLGLPYEEVHNMGLLGVITTGRTVPSLHVRTGAVISHIGDSPAILRYLWGAYATEYGKRAAFLEPAAEAVALEQQIDQYGVWLQQWLYRYILDHRDFTLHLWGVNDPTLPGWQRHGVSLFYPLVRSMLSYMMRTHKRGDRHPGQRIEEFLGEFEQKLSDGRQTLLRGEQISFVDISFAALSGLWVYPPEYGGGTAEAVRVEVTDYPEAMAAKIKSWKEKFPPVTALVERWYREERSC